jgi:hypothetical protein
LEKNLELKGYKMKKVLLTLMVALLLPIVSTASPDTTDTSKNPKIYIAFLWHMHQPIYMPYESIITTANSGAYSFNLYDVFNQRVGPYTDWPKNAVQMGINAGFGNFGAQVSFSGSLVENLNNIAAANACNGSFNNWKSHWNYITGQKTVRNNPRIDLVGFGYHHPLMGLIDYYDIRKSIQDHRNIFATNFPSYSYSKGIFPPENAFSVRMIPALVDEGIEWVLVDNFNFERASVGAPVGDGTGVKRPNKADILNTNPNDWTGLNGLWCPAPVSARWANQPKYVQYIDPQTGTAKKIIAVPASRYLGNEDGRGGFGALNYDYVMSQLESYNTDPNHPILIVLHHDGDNYGGGSEGYYGGNFANFVNWLGSQSSRFVCTTIQDYLEMFPPDVNDIIHVQDGSWVGADSGDPEFKKWNGDPGNYNSTPNYSPDRNSWGIITAAKNIVQTAHQVNPSSAHTVNAWKYYLNAQTSCYWYWDGTEMWDSHPARACNLAVATAANVLGGSYSDLTPPSIYLPQRFPYNPGDVEWDAVGVMSSDFKVWTYVYDHSGLQSVKLKYRLVDEGAHTATSVTTRTYAGGAGVGEWQEIPMTGITIPSITNPIPTYKSKEYSAEVIGFQDVLINYYVEAIDNHGNIAKSPIQHVWVGDGSGSGGGNVTWTPQNPNLNEYLTITASYANSSTYLHWGVNNSGSTWQPPHSSYWPSGTTLFNGTGPAVETQFTDNGDGVYQVVLGPFNNAAQVVNRVAFVVRHGSEWDNNNGNDYHITINNNPSDDPVGANGTITTLVNQHYNFSGADFYFQGTGGATFAGIKIESNVSQGNLTYNGIPITTGQDYPVVTNLRYAPPVGITGNPLTSFTFRVKDSEGRYSQLAYTISINVLSDFTDGVSWYPAEPNQHDMITIIVKNDANMNAGSKLHWGVNDWQQPIEAYRPDGSNLHAGTGPAVQTPFISNEDLWYVNLGPFNNDSQIVTSLDFVLYYGGSNWNNNGGENWHIAIKYEEDDDDDDDDDDDNSINEINSLASAISIYPNPMTTVAFIEINNDNNSSYEIQLLNTLGVAIISTDAKSGEKIVLNRNRLPSGLYFIRVRDINTNETKTIKLNVIN